MYLSNEWEGELILTGEHVRASVYGRLQSFDRGQLSRGIRDEIEDRLRNLDQEVFVNPRMDYRNRFSHNGNVQVQIRMRLKQVTRLVSGQVLGGT
jgi:hypothetical protein